MVNVLVSRVWGVPCILYIAQRASLNTHTEFTHTLPSPTVTWNQSFRFRSGSPPSFISAVPSPGGSIFPPGDGISSSPKPVDRVAAAESSNTYFFPFPAPPSWPSRSSSVRWSPSWLLPAVLPVCAHPRRRPHLRRPRSRPSARRGGLCRRGSARCGAAGRLSSCHRRFIAALPSVWLSARCSPSSSRRPLPHLR